MLDVSGVSSAAMVCSTVSDLNRLVDALQGGKLLKPTSVAEIMRTPQAEHFSYGWRIDDVNARKRLTRGGDIEGFSSLINDYPDQQVIVSLCNVGGVAPAKVASDLAAIAFGEPNTISRERRFIQLSEKDMRALAGTYCLASGGTICVTTSGDQLMAAPGGGGPVVCQPQSTSSCFLQPISDDVTFVRDSAGNVSGIRLGSKMEGEKKSATEYKQCPALLHVEQQLVVLALTQRKSI